jgi:hypothetical protein
MALKARKWFANGAGCMTRYNGSDILLFMWNGKPAGHARYISHVNRYSYAGEEYKSLAALLRAVAVAQAIAAREPADAEG